MKCPYCGSKEIFVVDSRPVDRNGRRRRYRCYSCDNRFTTYEYEIEQYENSVNEEAVQVAKKKLINKIVEYINDLSRED